MSRAFVILFLICCSTAFSQVIQSVDYCQDCHQKIVNEWKSSRHALSSKVNPFYAAMLNWANEDTDNKAEKMCVTCHEPVRQLEMIGILADVLAVEGVTCDVCHATQRTVQGNGSKLEVAPGNVKFGPFEDALSIDHKSELSQDLSSVDFCLTCHANLETSHGLSFCSTEQEYRKSSFAQKGVTCQDCHMPTIEGVAAELGKIRQVHSHFFYGAYTPDFLRDCASIKLEAELVENAYSLDVLITNETVGHELPTGSPMRSVYLKLEAQDSLGNVIWKNYDRNPLNEDPKAVFMRLLEDDKGNAPVPPWKAKNIRFDQRIKPDEVRKLSYTLPKEVTSIIASLYYRLAPPLLLKKLNITESPYIDSTLITTASIKVQ